MYFFVFVLGFSADRVTDVTVSDLFHFMRLLEITWRGFLG